MNREPFVTDEYYHIYNRGVDKRDVFMEEFDVKRFLRGMKVFNSKAPVKSIRDYFLSEDQPRGLTPGSEKLIEILCYCTLPNHYHLILKQLVDGGISEFMKRLGGGYTCYFNEKYERNGSLFQGTFKSVHVNSNEYLLHLSAYVNLNYVVHGINSESSELVRSSWKEYVQENEKFILCEKGIILDQFKNVDSYKKYAEGTVVEIRKRREEEKKVIGFFLE